MTDLARPVTQAEFGQLVDITQQAVSDLFARGVLTPGASAQAWLHEYTRHLREIAAGRQSAGGGDLVAERTRLAKEQADRIALQNAITKRELVPAGVLVELVSGIAAQVAVIFDALPGKIRREVPDLPSPALDAIARELAKGRNAVADMKIESLLDESTDGPACLLGEEIEV